MVVYLLFWKFLPIRNLCGLAGAIVLEYVLEDPEREGERLSDEPLYRSYLCVSPQGEIVADKRRRIVQPGFEIWQCDYFEEFFRVSMVHPRVTPVQIVRIDRRDRQVIQQKVQEHSKRKLQDARHEAGHAVLFYALRLFAVEVVDIRVTARLRGNLHQQVRTGIASSVSFISGTTSPLVSQADAQSRNTRDLLGVTCLAFGGTAATPGDANGLDGDLAKIRYILQGLLVSTAPSASKTPQEQERTIMRLSDRLKSLAHEIVAEPVAAARYEQLTKRLAESGWLNQEDVEAVLEPTTLPDYSHRLEAIRKEFDLPEQCGKGSSVLTASGRSGTLNPPIDSHWV